MGKKSRLISCTDDDACSQRGISGFEVVNIKTDEPINIVYMRNP